MLYQPKKTLLAIVVSAEGKSVGMAEAVVECLYNWNLQKNNVQIICFDTTASNTGGNQGDCKIIVDVPGRSLHNLACRH